MDSVFNYIPALKSNTTVHVSIQVSSDLWPWCNLQFSKWWRPLKSLCMKLPLDRQLYLGYYKVNKILLIKNDLDLWNKGLKSTPSMALCKQTYKLGNIKMKWLNRQWVYTYDMPVCFLHSLGDKQDFVVNPIGHSMY